MLFTSDLICGGGWPKAKKNYSKAALFQSYILHALSSSEQSTEKSRQQLGRHQKERNQGLTSMVMEEAASIQSHFMNCVGVVIQTLWW